MLWRVCSGKVRNERIPLSLLNLLVLDPYREETIHPDRQWLPRPAGARIGGKETMMSPPPIVNTSPVSCSASTKPSRRCLGGRGECRATTCTTLVEHWTTPTHRKSRVRFVTQHVSVSTSLFINFISLKWHLPWVIIKWERYHILIWSIGSSGYMSNAEHKLNAKMSTQFHRKEGKYGDI